MQFNDQHTLEIDSVELSFAERQILTSVYLKIETGRITAILGSNGSGKSCLMKVIFGELTPKHKSMRIDSIWHKSFSNKQVLYLPQYCCAPKRTKVSTMFDEFGVSFDEFTAHFPELNHLKGNRIGELSLGEQRIVEIFIMLRAESLFVMLDEPFSQIMPLHMKTIKALIKETCNRKGILLTDHMYKNVVEIADDLYVINNQTVYRANSTEDLIKHGYLSHLLK